MESRVAPAAISNPWLDQHYAVPQTLVRVGRRRRLNLLIAGEGAPTVIFAAGLNGTTLHWARVQRVIAAETRTVAFDKAGLGFSDPGPLPRTASNVVGDLRAALKAAAITPPYVLVGHSAGGPQMRLFAFRYPQEVVGMVMVDSSNEYQDRRMDQAKGDREIAAQRRELLRTYSRLSRLARTGALRPGTPDYDRAVGPPMPTVTPAVWNAIAAQRLSAGYWRALRSESAASNTSTSDQVAAARQALGDRPLGKMPLIVLTAGKNAIPRGGESVAAAEARHAMWQSMHDEIAALSSRGERRTVDAGHGIQMEKAEVVIAAIDEVLALARDS
jgi:pimeloyl-ACP methyl ester carboxylesterase